jgi:cellulose synthase/poly-beta-1,6-N-acetylglucosamine synthase-like glycosyltransferase
VLADGPTKISRAQEEGLSALLRISTPITRKFPSGIAVIVPARDESTDIAAALSSLAAQTLRPDRVIVVVNNSTDDTAEIAGATAPAMRPVSVDVLEMPGYNRYRKAGALNYGIRRLLANGRLPTETRYVLVMDGDTELDPHFLRRAQRVLGRDSTLGGVSAACLGKDLHGTTPWKSLLLLFQQVEYARFAVTRLRRNIHTMSGAGSFYRAVALNQLLAARPDVFEERDSNLVEDYETTLALKELGWRVTSNQGCIAYTDLMPTLRMLIAQRTRWVRGTVDEWRRYGWRRSTALSIAGLFAAAAGLVYTAIWAIVSARGVVIHGGQFDYRYLALSVFWSIYQGLAVWRLGRKAILLEMLLLPEVAFNILRYFWLARSIAASYRGSRRAWSR